MKYVIWGAGSRGERLFRHLKEEDVIAFIDKSDEKIGTLYCGKRVISLYEYINQYQNAIVVITHTFERNSIEELSRNNVKNYMLLSDCPAEFQEENTRPYLENYIKGIVNCNETYGIWGCTVYGLEVYSWLLEIGNNHSYIIMDKSISSSTVELLKQNNYKIIMENEVSPMSVNVVLNCEFTKNDYIFNDIVQKNIYDCSDVIKEYYNPKIEKLKNIHKNESCFIVATGPSLKIEDLEILEQKQIVTFGVNKLGYAYNLTDWRPTYYVGIDGKLLESEYFNSVKPEEQSKYSFIGDTSETYWKKNRKSNVLKHHFRSEWAIGRYPKFSDDFSRKSYSGGTVVYVCIQLAVYMGFSNIYLLGVDFTGAKEHGSKYNHFYEEKELTSISYTEQVDAAYKKARQYTEEHGVKIYNATRGGNLEVFERVNFDELFGN